MAFATSVDPSGAGRVDTGGCRFSPQFIVVLPSHYLGLRLETELSSLYDHSYNGTDIKEVFDDDCSYVLML